MLNIELPYDPPFQHSSLYLRKMKTYVHTKTCTWKFISVLFTIVEGGTMQCPLLISGYKIKWYIATMKY